MQIFKQTHGYMETCIYSIVIIKITRWGLKEKNAYCPFGNITLCPKKHLKNGEILHKNCMLCHQISLLGHMLLFKSCSTHQDLSNELYYNALLQNWFFHIREPKARPGRNFNARRGKVPGVKNCWKKITILLGSGVNSSEMC